MSSTSFLPSPTLYKVNSVIDKNSNKVDNMGSEIDSDGTVDKDVNNKNCVQNQADSLNC